ncbi:DUF3095 domain-containing protein [Pedobacter hartonius]|uniref:DUF3095 domain-containing protein n=1 Tax=Pedobacter hartonius TaxID=425514 RepID=A0A1H4DU67_9SPHI|nr:DUF3095 domain-containing protein [Pedobacter hartonius]SEA76146.1 Protein of unknown function [Pedobacter hartonius]
MSNPNARFYSDLRENQIPLQELLSRDSLFHKVPDNWHVIITDIRNSTSAVQNGLHQTVNLIATGSIVTVLNITFRANIVIPFFFGGDGATFIVPPTIIDSAMSALLLFRANTLENFNLDLRVGTMLVSRIYEQGHELKISKFKSSKTLYIPVVLGTGLGYAEKVIKGDDYLFPDRALQQSELDLTGMSCRWDKIAPPENHNEVVTLLAVAGTGTKQSDAFRKVIMLLDQIYGTPEKRQPISISKLKLKTTFNRIELEMRATLNNGNFFKKFYEWFTHMLGHLYFKTRKGKDYLSRLVNMSDTLVIDGRINTVISGTDKQRLRLQESLDELEQQGLIKFGLYVSPDSIMSCYVKDLQDEHIHFVDGSEGGYTNAAGVLKQKLRG